MEILISVITAVVATVWLFFCLGVCKFIFRRVYEDDVVFASVGMLAWLFLTPVLPMLVNDLLSEIWLR